MMEVKERKSFNLSGCAVDEERVSKVEMGKGEGLEHVVCVDI